MRPTKSPLTRRARTWLTRTTQSLCLLAVVTACSSTPTPTPTPIGETITHPLTAPGVPYVPPSQTGSSLNLATYEPRTDLTAATAMPWTFYDEVNPGLLVVATTIGTPHCFAPTAQVQEYPDRVEVAVSIGKLPGAADSCTAEATTAGVRVHLTTPLGQRPVLDPNR